MKTKQILWAFAVIALFSYASCKKNKDAVVENPHNKDLRKKDLNEIRAAIAGTWEYKRACGCGFAGCSCGSWPAGDFVSFLTNDTVKRVTNGITTIYEKAIITRKYIYAFSDTGFLYSMGNGFQIWAMDQIKNDTLLISEDPNTYYLIKR